ncbi:YraN family protein [Candidatus Agathobaculum pullicola]|uniref:YraN family protein n=1 Tax=Candidatus Agathobaculum pullicola TaxID=2838426 RepID=UPI003F91D85E
MKGAWGERTARDYLERAGYRTVETNFRTRLGEIDIIASRGEYIVFVEVKTRKSDRFAAAREAVTAAKQQRITAAAALWLQQHPSGLQPRFDVVEVYGEEGATVAPRIYHLENAFGG